MKPLSISLKNYKSYGDDEVSVRLDIDSVRLVVGKSGSGKTSIMDAIIWCLYGKSLANSDDVVNRQTNKNCKVEFSFLIGEDEFSVIRYRKHDENGNKVLIFKNNKNISPVKISDANQLVQDIVEISYNAFISSIIFSGEIYSSFMREKNSVRLNIFEGILSLRQVNKWNDTAKKLAKPLIEKANELQGKKEQAISAFDTITDNIKSYKNNAVATLNKFKEEKSNIYTKIQNLDKELEEIKEIDLQEELKKNKDHEEISEKYEKISKQIEEAETKLPDLNSLLMELNGLKSRKERISNIDPDKVLKQIKERETQEQELAKLQSEEEKLTREIVNVDVLEKEKKRLEKRLKELQEEINKIEHDLSCPTCGQDLPKELADELGLLDKRSGEKRETEDRITKLNNDVEGAVRTNTGIGDRISRIRQQIADCKNILQGFSGENFTAEEIRTIEKEQSGINTKIQLIEQDYENKEERSKEIDEEIRTLKISLPNSIPEASNYSQDYLESLTIRESEIDSELRESKSRIEIIDEKAQSIYDKEYVVGLDEKKNKLAKVIAKLDKDLEKKEYEKRHYNFLGSLFSNKEGGIKKFVIGQMIGVFNDEVNKYLPLFFDEDIQIEFDKNLIETIKQNGQETSFHSYSSGEKTRFEFAIAFSLFMLVKNFFSSDINFIVFDEILDMNLDEESLEKVLSVVKDLGDNNAILIISHRSELRDIFTNHINVSKNKKGFSVVREA